MLNIKRIDDRAELLAIKNGEYSYEEIIEMVDILQKDIEKLSHNNKLPATINQAKALQFLINLRTKLYE